MWDYLLRFKDAPPEHARTDVLRLLHTCTFVPIPLRSCPGQSYGPCLATPSSDSSDRRMEGWKEGDQGQTDGKKEKKKKKSSGSGA